MARNLKVVSFHMPSKSTLHWGIDWISACFVFTQNLLFWIFRYENIILLIRTFFCLSNSNFDLLCIYSCLRSWNPPALGIFKLARKNEARSGKHVTILLYLFPSVDQLFVYYLPTVLFCALKLLSYFAIQKCSCSVVVWRKFVLLSVVHCANLMSIHSITERFEYVHVAMPQSFNMPLLILRDFRSLKKPIEKEDFDFESIAKLLINATRFVCSCKQRKTKYTNDATRKD